MTWQNDWTEDLLENSFSFPFKSLCAIRKISMINLEQQAVLEVWRLWVHLDASSEKDKLNCVWCSYLIVTPVPIRPFAKWHDLPQHDSIAPHVTWGCKFAILDRFKRRPSDGNLTTLKSNNIVKFRGKHLPIDYLSGWLVGWLIGELIDWLTSGHFLSIVPFLLQSKCLDTKHHIQLVSKSHFRTELMSKKVLLSALHAWLHPGDETQNK